MQCGASARRCSRSPVSGTRFLPATKTVPKEMLPIVDRPLIQYAVDEAIEAGCDTLVFVTNRYKHAVADYFDKAYELEQKLEKRRQAGPAGADPQRAARKACARYSSPRPKRWGWGMRCCAREPVVGDEPFAVLLPDDLIWNQGDGALKQMADRAQASGGSVVAVQDVPREQTGSYGIVATDAFDGQQRTHPRRSWRSPSPEQAPSNLAVVGRYILTPAIFDLLETTQKGTGGEIQLTDAIAALLGKERVDAFRFRGTRFDCGTHIGLIEATIRYALDNEKLSDAARELMQNALGEMGVFET